MMLAIVLASMAALGAASIFPDGYMPESSKPLICAIKDGHDEREHFAVCGPHDQMNLIPTCMTVVVASGKVYKNCTVLVQDAFHANNHHVRGLCSVGDVPPPDMGYEGNKIAACFCYSDACNAELQR